MLRILQVEELESILLELPYLVRQQEQRSPDFVAKTKQWLTALELALSSNRLYQAGLIAALKSELVSTENGRTPSGIEVRGRATSSRVSAAVASETLHRASEIAGRILDDQRQRISEAQRLAHQLVASGMAMGSIPERAGANDNSEYLRTVHRSLKESAGLGNAVTHLQGLVGPHDSLLLIDRALSSFRAAPTNPAASGSDSN